VECLIFIPAFYRTSGVLSAPAVWLRRQPR